MTDRDGEPGENPPPLVRRARRARDEAEAWLSARGESRCPVWAITAALTDPDGGPGCSRREAREAVHAAIQLGYLETDGDGVWPD